MWIKTEKYKPNRWPGGVRIFRKLHFPAWARARPCRWSRSGAFSSL